MKKTLTVNLGGIVFHVDEDAYRLIDNYLKNLRIHFHKETGADEIVDDIEHRMSELFTEKVETGVQVITIADVEEVIARMGNPEDMDTEECAACEEQPDGKEAGSGHADCKGHRFYRNPDDRILGGVVGGLAAFVGWDATWVRLLLVFLLFWGAQLLVPFYIICWILLPEARTAAEKLSMRGEAITISSIGKTVTDGFGQAADGVNEYMGSEKPRTLFRRAMELLVDLIGWCLKLALVLFVIVSAPVLLVCAIVFVVLMILSFTMLIGGGATLISLFPSFHLLFPGQPVAAMAMYIACVLLVIIPLASLVWAIMGRLFGWRPIPTGLKWTFVVLWIVSAAVFGICFAIQGPSFSSMYFLPV